MWRDRYIRMYGKQYDGTEFQPDSYLLMFQPDLLHNTPLGRTMREYSFFSYETNEALHERSLCLTASLSLATSFGVRCRIP